MSLIDGKRSSSFLFGLCKLRTGFRIISFLLLAVSAADLYNTVRQRKRLSTSNLALGYAWPALTFVGGLLAILGVARKRASLVAASAIVILGVFLRLAVIFLVMPLIGYSPIEKSEIYSMFKRTDVRVLNGFYYTVVSVSMLIALYFFWIAYSLAKYMEEGNDDPREHVIIVKTVKVTSELPKGAVPLVDDKSIL